jgi:hypothetical protein
MTETIVHFVFTPSGAGCLGQALRKAGRNDRVVTSFDDLSFGPINPPDPSLRSKWVENELCRTEWIPDDSERRWREALSPDHRNVAWLTRRSAMEYAGFLEWLWRLGDEPCEVVDLTDVKVSYSPEHGPPRPPRFAMSLGMLHHDKICSDKLWDLAKPLQMTERRGYLDLWRQLRSENAPLRVSDGGKLVSAPISFFDAVLMSYVTDHWQKVGRVVGHAMIPQMDDCTIQTGDMLLLGRVNALVESGRLEVQGKSPLEMHRSEVRLPRSRG